MIECCLSPKGIQSYCRDERLWANKLVINYLDEGYRLDIILFTTYRSTKPKEILSRSFDTKEEMNTFIGSLRSLYPRIDIAIYDYRKGEN